MSWQALFRKLRKINYLVTPHIFANGSHLVALNRLRTTKTGSKLPRSQFSPKRRLFLYVYRPLHLLFMAHPNISLRFQVTGQRVKISVFQWFPFPSTKKSFGLHSDATDLPHSQLPLYSKVFRSTLKVDLVSFHWRPAFSKVSISEKLSIIFSIFRAK